MLSVDLLYNRVNDLSGKGQNGYHSNDEFNDNLNHAQNFIMNFLLEKDGSDKGVDSFLYPFILSPEIPYPFLLPSDYREGIEVCAIVSTECGDKKPYYASPLRHDQRKLILDSPIRRPDASKGRFSYDITGNKINVYPSYFNGLVMFKYYRNPNPAKRATTIDVNTDGEVYDSSNSVQLEWPEKTIDHFVDILLYMKGIILRESPLLRYIESKNILSFKNRQND